MSRPKPYSRESIGRALAHHEARGALLTCSPPGHERPWWVVTLPDYGERVELTTAQAWALCLGLRGSEIVATLQRERFEHELAALSDARDREIELLRRAVGTFASARDFSAFSNDKELSAVVERALDGHAKRPENEHEVAR